MKIIYFRSKNFISLAVKNKIFFSELVTFLFFLNYFFLCFVIEIIIDYNIKIKPLFYTICKKS